MVLPKQYLCPVNDAKALNQQISHSLNNLEGVRQDFQSVFEFAAKELVLDGMLQNIERVYHEVLNAK